MTVLKPLTRFVDTVVTLGETNGQVWQDTQCQTLFLEDNVDYLVLYCANLAFDSAEAFNGWCQLRCVHGAEVLGEVQGTSIGGQLAESMNSTRHNMKLRGMTIVKGTGAQNIHFEATNPQELTPLGLDCHIFPQAIIAIPLDQLNVDVGFGTVNQTDIFASFTNQDTVVVEDPDGGPPDNWVPALTETWDIPEAGDWLILMSVEAKPTDGDPTDPFTRRHQVYSRFMVDDVARVDDFYQIGKRAGGSQYDSPANEAQVERHSFSFVEVVTLTKGEHEFRIDVTSNDQPGVWPVDRSQYRRPRMFAINSNSFRAIEPKVSNTAVENIEATSQGSDLENAAGGAHTTNAPPVDEWAVIIGASTVQGGTVDQRPTGGCQELFDQTNFLRHCLDQVSSTDGEEDFGDFPSSFGGKKFAQYLLLYAYEETALADRDWRVRFGVAGNPTGQQECIHGAKRAQGLSQPSKSSLIFWNLTTTVQSPPPTERPPTQVLPYRRQTRALIDYLPHGKAFGSKEIPGTVTYQLLEGMAAETLRADDLLLEFLREILPDFTVLMLSEWESALAIPDDCFDGMGTDDERRRDILVKLASLGVQTAADFVSLAALYGVTVSVTGGFAAGGFPLTFPVTFSQDPKTARHTIVVTFAEDTPGLFPYTFPLTFGSKEITTIQCLFNKLKPAHCQIVYTNL